MADKVLLDGEFDQQPIVDAVQKLINTLKELQAQGKLTSSSIDEITDSAEKLQATASKPIAPIINDGSIAKQSAEVKNNMEQMSASVEKNTVKVKRDLAGMARDQEKYKSNIVEINTELVRGEKIYDNLVKKLGDVINSYAKFQREVADRATTVVGYAQSPQAKTDTNELEVRGDAIDKMQKETDEAAESNKKLSVSLAQNEVALKTNTKQLAAATLKTELLAAAQSALVSFGITLAIAAVGLLIAALVKYANQETEAERATRLLSASLGGFADGVAKATTEVSTMRIQFELAAKNTKMQDEVLKIYNETLGKTLGVQTDFNAAQQAFIDGTDDYIEIVGLRSEADAIASLKKAAYLEKEKKDLGLVDETGWFQKANDAGLATLKGIAGIFSKGESDANEIYKKLKKDSRDRFNFISGQENQKDIDVLNARELEVRRQLAEREGRYADNPKTLDKLKAGSKKRVKEIINIYAEELQKIRDGIAKLDANTFTDEAVLTKQVNEDFRRRKAILIAAFQKGKLTLTELENLAGNALEADVFGGALGKEYQLTLQQTLSKFADEKAAFLQKIDDQILSANIEATTNNLKLIKDQFDRERELIELENQKTLSSIERSRKEKTDEISKSSILTPEAKGKAIQEINDALNELIESVNIQKQKAIQDLALKAFEASTESVAKSFTNASAGLSRESVIDITKQAELFQLGEINYAEYQKELTRIAKEESDKRLALEIDNLRRQIRIRESEIMANGDKYSEEQKEQLLQEIQDLQNRLAIAVGNQVKGGVENPVVGKTQLEVLQEYATAVSSAIQSIGQAWQTANDEEQKALTRSIAIQERRVDAARRLAARGNAEYLKMEEEKQQQLILQQEQAARRQMAINAALQASQLLVAVTGAIAKIAEPGIGTVEVITSIGVIIGALATGYALVNSLTKNQPTFFTGTEDTGRGGSHDNKGGFVSVLHPHERIITAEENKKLKGLSNKQVIELVENYKVIVGNYIKPEPRLNVAGMNNASNQTSVENTAMTKFLEENNRELKLNNQLQLRTHKLLKNMGISVSMDKEGIAVSVLEVVDEIQKSKLK